MALNPQAIQNHRNMLLDPSTSENGIFATLRIIREQLCKEDYKEQIDIIAKSNLNLDIYNYTLKQMVLFNTTPVISELNVNILVECLWIFTNLSMDNTGKALAQIQNGIVQISLKCLTFIQYPAIIQCDLQLIGNIISDNTLQIKLAYLRSEIFYKFFLEHAYKFWQYKGTCDETITWAIGNTFRNLPKVCKDAQIGTQIVMSYLPIISNLLCLPAHNAQTHRNLYFALYYISSDWTFAYEFIYYITKNRFNTVTEAIKMLLIDIYGNMAAESDFGVKILIQDENLFSHLLNKLKNKKPLKQDKKCMKSYAWILSNILAGTPAQIDYLLTNHSTFFNEIYEIFQINDNFAIVKELVWAISNMLHCCSLSAFEMLFSSNVLVCLSQKVSKMVQDGTCSKIAIVYLQGIQNYIKKHNEFPEKTALQMEQKTTILKTLAQIQPYINEQSSAFRLQNVMSYLESILAIGQINAIAI